MSPRVSVVMAAFNCEQFLREAIESILNQTFSDFEFLIVDDGSTDATSDLLAEFARKDKRIQAHCFDYNHGLAVALNHGIGHASGEYIARMDADDISMPERLATQVAFMEVNLDVGICGTWIEVFGDTKGHVWKYPTDHPDIVAQMLFSNALAHPSVMMRAGLLAENNLRYDENIRYAQDYELWSRAIYKMIFANIPQILVKHRRHKKSIGDQHLQAQLQTHGTVYSRLLKPFGLGEAPDDIRIHSLIGTYQFENDIEFLMEARNWLERLLIANLNLNIIAPKSLAAELGQRWTLICQRSGVHPLKLFMNLVSTPLIFQGKMGIQKFLYSLLYFIGRFIASLRRAISR